MRILVTEGAGFIGGHLTESFLEDGHDVTVLNNFEPFYAEGIKRHTLEVHREVADDGDAEYRFVEGDLLSLAADRGYDAKAFRDELRENGIRPLIKHRIMNPLDHAHNARVDGDRYHQRSTSETVFSSIKRTIGSPCVREAGG